MKKNDLLTFTFEDFYNQFNIPTRELNLENISPYSEDLDKIKKKIVQLNRTILKPDYSNFSNHTFFASALDNVNVAIDRIQRYYPFDQSLNEIQEWEFSGSGFENFIANYEYPKYVGHVNFNGINQFITASNCNCLSPGSGSLTVEGWINLPKELKSVQTVLEHSSSSNSYIRLRKLSASHNCVFEIQSGTIGVALTTSFASGSWVYFAGVLNRNSGTLQFYTGSTTQTPLKVQEITSSISNNIYFSASKLYIATGTLETIASREMFTGSLNEFRVWTTASTLSFLTKNYAKTVYKQDHLKLLYRFNESITTTGSLDQFIFDYSAEGEILDGKYVNYLTASSRTSGSIWLNEQGEYILYPTHPDVITFTEKWQTSGSLYDAINDNLITNMIPDSILQEDEDNGDHLNILLKIIARFFDDIKLYIDQFENLLHVNYDNINETPDIFLPMLAELMGWKLGSHFLNSDSLAYFYGENIISSGSISNTLANIKNSFYERVLNNLIYLHKTRGTKESLLAILRLYGFNPDILKIKEYGDIQGKSIVDSYNHNIRSDYLLWLGSGSTNSNNISASVGLGNANIVNNPNIDLGTSWTAEIRVRLPHTASTYFSSTFLTGAIWNFVDNGSDLISSTRTTSLFYERNSLTSSAGKLVLYTTSSDTSNIILKTDPINIFDGKIYNIAVSFNNLTGNIRYFRLDEDIVETSGSFSSPLTQSTALTGNIFPLVGTYTEFSNLLPIIIPVNVMVQEFRIWNKNLSDIEIKEHTLNYRSVATNDLRTDFDKLKINWRINENTLANSLGQITIKDFTPNKNDITGSGFIANKNSFVNLDLDYNLLIPELDLKWREDKIRIHTGSFIKEKDQAQDSKEISLEFNLVDALNEDISNLFLSFKEFNSLIGKPENYYRSEYIGLEALSKTYFKRLENSLNFKNFFGLFKWFDFQFIRALEQVMPAKSNFLGGIFAVESHILERNKLDFKYPIIRTPPVIPVAAITASFNTPTQDFDFINLSSSFSYIRDPKYNRIFKLTASMPKYSLRLETRFGNKPTTKEYKNGSSIYYPNDSWLNTRNEKAREQLTRQMQTTGSLDNHLHKSEGNRFVSKMIGNTIQYRNCNTFEGTGFAFPFDLNGYIVVDSFNRGLIHKSLANSLISLDVRNSELPEIAPGSASLNYNFSWPKLTFGVTNIGGKLQRILNTGRNSPKDGQNDLQSTPSEINYGGGLGQLMYASIIGTQNRGSAGILESDVITSRLIGSRIMVLWPQQTPEFTVSQPLTNAWQFEGVNPGQEPGILSSSFIPGLPVELSSSDSKLRIYVYTQLDAGSLSIGTLEIKIETSPSLNTAFASEQFITTLTGSARLDDLVYSKSPPGGIMTSTEPLRYYIDIPINENMLFENAKFIKIAARRTVAGGNLYCLILGRII